MKKLLLFLLLALPAFGGRWFYNPGSGGGGSGGSQKYGTSLVSSISFPITMAVFVAPRQITNMIPLALNTSTNGDERIAFATSTLGEAQLSTVNTAGSSVTVTATGAMPTGSYWHLAGVWESTNNRICYTNGIAGVTNTTSNSANGFNKVGVGSRSDSAVGYRYAMDGALAEAAIWNAALTAAEILSLAQGAAPYTVRPTALVFYAPMIGTSTANDVNLLGLPVIWFNSPPNSTNHPRIYRP